MIEVLAFLGALLLLGILAWGLIVLRFKIWDDHEKAGP